MTMSFLLVAKTTIRQSSGGSLGGISSSVATSSASTQALTRATMSSSTPAGCLYRIIHKKRHFVPGRSPSRLFSDKHSRQYAERPRAISRGDVGKGSGGGGRNRYQSSKASKQRKSTLAQQQQQATASTEAALNSERISAETFFERVNRVLNKPRTIPIPRWVSPTHSTTTLSECFGHSSFILVAISYAVDDFVQLRLLAIAGSSVMLVFTYFHPHGRVLWLPFKWNVLFIAINTYRVMKVHADRYYAQKLSPLLLHIHDHHFYVMDKVDFARMMRLGQMEHFKTGDVVVAQDQPNRYVRLVLRGELHVERDGQTTYMLNEGNFISESGLHAGLLLRGNINSCCSVLANSDDVVTVRWDRTELMQLLEIDKNIRNSLKAVMSWDIVSKLKSQRLLLARGKISNAEQWTLKRREQTVHRYRAILANMLSHPQYLNKRKDELSKYRDIHHIDDEEHEQILNQLGWTLADFEKGSKDGQVDEDLAEMKQYGWRWYARELKLRIIG